MNISLSGHSLSSLTYILVSVAKADYHMTDDEEAFIIRKLSEYNNGESNIHATLEQSVAIYQSQSKQDRKYALERACSKLRDTASTQLKEGVLETIEDLISADGIVRDLEVNMLQVIKKKLF